MKKIILFLGLIFLGTASFSQDTENYDDRVEEFSEGFMLDIGTAYLSDAPEMYNVRTGRPSTINLYWFKRFKVIREIFTINAGIGLGLDSYFFEEDVIFDPANTDTIGYIYPFEDRDFKKSKLAANYVDIPIELYFKTSNDAKKAFRIGVGGKVGILFDGHSKIKYEVDDVTFKEKRDARVLNNFRYGLSARVGYSFVNFFAYYGLSPLLEDDALPEINPFIFGITLTGF